jgi:hypothetical protein
VRIDAARTGSRSRHHPPLMRPVSWFAAAGFASAAAEIIRPGQRAIDLEMDDR